MDTKLLGMTVNANLVTLVTCYFCAGPSKIGMDDQEFHSATFQRVYQYLRRHIANMNLDHFQYQTTSEGTPDDCLKLFLQYVIFIHTYIYLPKYMVCTFHLDIVELRTLPGQRYTTLQSF